MPAPLPAASRLDRHYQDISSNARIVEDMSRQSDAFGATARVDIRRAASGFDQTGLGYTYLAGPGGWRQAAAGPWTSPRAVRPEWTLSGAYIYRQPDQRPCPLTFMKEQRLNPGAVLAEPRGPTIPFESHWDIRKRRIS